MIIRKIRYVEVPRFHVPGAFSPYFFSHKTLLDLTSAASSGVAVFESEGGKKFHMAELCLRLSRIGQKWQSLRKIGCFGQEGE